MTRLAQTVLAMCLGVGLAQQGSTSALAQGASALSSPEPPARLLVTVHTHSNLGRVFCAIWRGPEGYPTEREHNVGEDVVRTLARHQGTCVFRGLPPGEYAIAVFHDENANNDLDQNIFGIPMEGTGASNDAYNLFGPPSYGDARFQYPRVPLHRLEIHVRY